MVEVKSWGGGDCSVKLFLGRECRNLVTATGEFECAPHEAAARLLRKLAELGIETLRASSADGE